MLCYANGINILPFEWSQDGGSILALLGNIRLDQVSIHVIELFISQPIVGQNKLECLFWASLPCW